MEQIQKCPECGSDLPAAAPAGPCLGCALKLGLQTAHATATAADANPTAPAPAGTIRLALVASEQAGDIVGRYKLLEKIGEGGFGAVYVAEQREPVKRRVALKIIKLGMDTKEVVARFEAERQALAMMDHPNIAKVLDAGALDNGRPYFVMELVRGIKITEYCDQNKLSTRERLDLFVKICQAVQHAHQKGIIHRDIKPSNILVTLHDGVPVPKVIDFGIAKATQGELTNKTVYTQFQQFIGTPAYMSPEQAEMSGLDIDTRSDIYSLGVLLYELLTGKTPFEQKDLIKAGLYEMRRIIREQEPARPSTCLSTMVQVELTNTAARRQSDAPKLVHSVRGDLDWIVMKCLEKDRTRRYETANGLAADLKRHLENEPILARPPSAAYRFHKAWRRNRAAFSVAAVIGVALIAATAISAWQAIRATRAETLAKERLADSEAISKFLTELYQSANPARDGRTITVAETLDKSAKKLEADLATQPERKAKLLGTIATTYDGLGLYREAIALQEKVRDYSMATYGLENAATLTAVNLLANYYLKGGRRDEALKLWEEALPIDRKVLGPAHSDTIGTMQNLAVAYSGEGRHEQALKLFEEVLTLRRKVSGPEHRLTIKAIGNLASCYADSGRYQEAITLAQEALTLERKVFGPEHPTTIMGMVMLTYCFHAAGQKLEALGLSEQALILGRRVYGPEHPVTLTIMGNLAFSYEEAGRRDEALKLHEQVLELRRKVLGPAHPDTLTAMVDLANSYYQIGRQPAANALLEAACATDPKFTLAHLTLAAWQVWFDRASAYEDTRVSALQGVEDSDSPLAKDRAARAYCLKASTNTLLLAKALRLARPTVAQGAGSASPQLGLGLTQYRNGLYSAAEETLAKGTIQDTDDPSVGTARLIRAMSLFRLDRSEEARKLFKQVEAQMPPLPKNPSKPTAEGKYLDHDILIWWLLYTEAKVLIEGARAEQ